MKKYEVDFLVDSKRTTQIVNAQSAHNAQELIKAQYPMSKVYIKHVKCLD